MSDSGILLPEPIIIARNSIGEAISGALLQFYLTGTTTPATVYADGGLSAPLSNPVVANGSGQFPSVYLDPSVAYRVQYMTATGSVLADVDPLNLDVVAATQAQVNAGTATDVYVSPATLGAWTGVTTALGYTPVNKAGDTATNLVINPAAPAAASAGYLGSPINTQNGAYTLALSDCGKTILSTGSSAATWTIPANATVALPVNTIVVFLVTGGASMTIAPAPGVTLNLLGSGASGGRTLAQWGLATASQQAPNQWVIGGINLT